jgi:hypothetical protein
VGPAGNTRCSSLCAISIDYLASTKVVILSGLEVDVVRSLVGVHDIDMASRVARRAIPYAE